MADKRLAWLKNRLDRKDFRGVVGELRAANLGNCPADLASEFAAVCVQAAQVLHETDPAAAQWAIERAFQLDHRWATRKKSPGCGSS